MCCEALRSIESVMPKRRVKCVHCVYDTSCVTQTTQTIPLHTFPVTSKTREHYCTLRTCLAGCIISPHSGYNASSPYTTFMHFAQSMFSPQPCFPGNCIRSTTQTLTRNQSSHHITKLLCSIFLDISGVCVLVLERVLFT